MKLLISMQSFLQTVTNIIFLREIVYIKNNTVVESGGDELLYGGNRALEVGEKVFIWNKKFVYNENEAYLMVLSSLQSQFDHKLFHKGEVRTFKWATTKNLGLPEGAYKCKTLEESCKHTMNAWLNEYQKETKTSKLVA